MSQLHISAVLLACLDCSYQIENICLSKEKKERTEASRYFCLRYFRILFSWLRTMEKEKGKKLCEGIMENTMPVSD